MGGGVKSCFEVRRRWDKGSGVSLGRGLREEKRGVVGEQMHDAFTSHLCVWRVACFIDRTLETCRDTAGKGRRMEYLESSSIAEQHLAALY